ncbi:MAG TPA: cytochrome P450 [Candidatus Binataceae bacterium]|nr:cytochrome P450 [Candidatus Binataceae bacterium]
MAGSAPYFNPWDPEFRANPYPHYSALLSGPPPLVTLGPVHAVLVARYADVSAAMRDHQNFSSVPPPPAPGAFQPFGDSRDLLGQDPPEHTRLRRLISREFTPRRIRDLEPRIRQIARELIDDAATRGEFDVMADLANVLPVMVIAEMLGVPSDKYATFKDWSDRIVDAGNSATVAPPPDAISAFMSLISYFVEEVARRRKEPGPDLVSALIAARDQADALSEPALLQFIVLLLLAGNETTTNLIGNGSLALLRHPDQFELLRREPELLPRAIEEMLRFDPPVQSTGRFPKNPVSLGGVEIPAGAVAFMILAAANRDPAKFPDPERFDIAREPNEHLSFGEGVHFCIGAPLARLEARIVFEEMLRRCPHLELAKPGETLSYKGSYFLRGLESLKVTCR